MNHVNLIGTMKSRPMFLNENGKRVAKFTIQTSEDVLDASGETQKIKEWHRITAWGRWVQVLEELSVGGMSLAVEGKLKTRFFHLNGRRQAVSEVEVNDLIIL